MRTARTPFGVDDLVELDERLLSRAARVVPMYDVFKGDAHPDVIGLRHDVDDNPLSFETALAFAEWEFERGYSSTYYLLHGSHYWGRALVEAYRFVDLGHEVGLHVNALALALKTGDDPKRILRRALREIRGASGVEIRGCVAHGDALCHEAHFVNDEIFVESTRADYGAANRALVLGDHVVELDPFPRSSLGLEYDAAWLPRGHYLSDSGGEWSRSLDDVVDEFGTGQLHALIHPDWWSAAFEAVLA